MSGANTVSAERVCVRCGRCGVQQYISARQDGTPAVTGEAWVCANGPACRRRMADRPGHAQVEIPPAVERAERALVEAWHGTVGRAFHPRRVRETRAALAAALERDCHEAVVPDWADGEEMPCNAYAVAYREEVVEDAVIGIYPVCEEHARPPLVPLTKAILGGAS